MAGYNVELEQRWWAIADGLGFIPKDDSEICHRNCHPPRRGWLPRFGTPRDIIWMGTWRTLHPRRILHTPSAISVHGEPRTRALLSGAEDSIDWATVTRFEQSGEIFREFNEINNENFEN